MIKLRILYYAVKYAFLKGWYRSWDNAGDDNPRHSPRSLAYFKLQTIYSNAYQDLLRNGK